MTSSPPDPERIRWSGFCFRTTPESARAIRGALPGEAPTQPSARWNDEGITSAHYFALSADAAWAEWVRYAGRLPSYGTRALWLCHLSLEDVADLRGFDEWARSGRDARHAVGAHEATRAVGQALRAAGYRAVLSPSAALSGAVNLTVFDELRPVEVDLLNGERPPATPSRIVRVQRLCVAGPPRRLPEQVVFDGDPHPGLMTWLDASA